MTVRAIDNAKLLDQDGLYTVHIERGLISRIERQGSNPLAEGDVLNASGGLVTPSLVDAHLHLDLVFSADVVPANQSGTLLEAIGLWSQAKRTLSAENVRQRALRAIHEEVRYGTGFIRSHVDVASAAELRLCEGVLAAREAAKDLCEIQLVAFPQDGLVRDPDAVELVRQACRSGVDLVGGIPHIERTPRDSARHLELVFDLAAQLDRDIDVHIDETDDPYSVCTEHLASLTIERGWQGRVTASHVCALSSYCDVHASRIMDLIAEAGINVVTNPGVNLHLQGRFDTYPKRRGLTRVQPLLERGVLCAAGQDCIRDPFYPFGTGQILDQAFLLAHADHMGTPPLIRKAFEMVCGLAGRLVGLHNHAVVGGAPANLSISPAGDVLELVRARPTPTSVLRGGRVVARAGNPEPS